MAKGHENLIPLDRRTKEEQREIVTAGGRASGVARRRTKTMREALKILLQMDTTDPKKAEALEALGVAPTFLNSIQLAMIGKAEAGDVEAFRAVRDTSGEKPAQAVEMAVSDKPFEALDLKALSDDDLKTLAEDGDGGDCGTDVVQSATSDG